jgi:hypothetical protein
MSWPVPALQDSGITNPCNLCLETAPCWEQMCKLLLDTWIISAHYLGLFFIIPDPSFSP